MRKRLKLRRKNYIFKKHGKFKIGIIIVIFIVIGIVSMLRLFNNKISPILLDYANIEARKLASIMINNAVSKNATEDISVEELFLITRDSDNEIKTIDFNPIIVNKILTNITNSVQINLKYIEQGKVDLLDLASNNLIDYDINKLKKGIFYEIPSGVVFGPSFLANIGPKIPVKLGLIGDIVSHINTKVTDYGINNALIEVNIVMELTEQVILPFVTQKIKIQTSIPIAMKLIQGSVPNYYLNGINQNSPSFALPIE